MADPTDAGATVASDATGAAASLQDRFAAHDTITRVALGILALIALAGLVVLWPQPLTEEGTVTAVRQSSVGASASAPDQELTIDVQLESGDAITVTADLFSVQPVATGDEVIVERRSDDTWGLVGQANALPPLIDGKILELETVELGEGFAGQERLAGQLRVELLSGDSAGTVIDIDTELTGLPELAVGDRLKLSQANPDDPGSDWFINDFSRGFPLTVLALLFVAGVLAIGGRSGARSLVGLAVSLAIVVLFIVPALLAGQSPAMVAFVGALAVMITTLYITHRFDVMTSAAVLGTAAALLLTTILGLIFIDFTALTGFSSEEAQYAQYAVEDLDLSGLILAGLIIATLGVLDDVTIAQSSTVFQLRAVAPHLTATDLFTRAMKVGRDHIASTVNTLVLAYAGASLALLMLLSSGASPWGELLTSEVVAVEVVKTLVGSLGLMTAVPFTTLLAARAAIRTAPEAASSAADGAHNHG